MWPLDHPRFLYHSYSTNIIPAVDVSQRLADLAEQGSDLDYGSGSDGYGIKKFWVHLNCFDAGAFRTPQDR